MNNGCIVYKPKKIEIFLSKFLPHVIPFISKRKRVIVRNHFRYAYQRRLMEDLTKLLRRYCQTKLVDEINKKEEWSEKDYSWEVI